MALKVLNRGIITYGYSSHVMMPRHFSADQNYLFNSRKPICLLNVRRRSSLSSRVLLMRCERFEPQKNVWFCIVLFCNQPGSLSATRRGGCHIVTRSRLGLRIGST